MRNTRWAGGRINAEKSVCDLITLQQCTHTQTLSSFYYTHTHTPLLLRAVLWNFMVWGGEMKQWTWMEDSPVPAGPPSVS